MNGEDEKLRNIVSWKSALRGLAILADENDYLWDNWKEARKEIEIGKEDKKKIKTSLKFIKYIIKKI